MYVHTCIRIITPKRVKRNKTININLIYMYKLYNKYCKYTIWDTTRVTQCMAVMCLWVCANCSNFHSNQNLFIFDKYILIKLLAHFCCCDFLAVFGRPACQPVGLSVYQPASWFVGAHAHHQQHLLLLFICWSFICYYHLHKLYQQQQQN